MTPRALYLAGAAAALTAAIGGVFAPRALAQAWHFAVVACLQPLLGGLFLALLHQTTGGAWGNRLAPSLAAARRMMPWALAGLLSTVIFLPAIHPWAGHPELVGDRAIFLNIPFHAIRTALYLIVFFTLAWCVHRGRRPAAGGLILFAMTGYFLAVDLVMAVAPDWYSSGFPVVFMASQALMALAGSIFIEGSFHDDGDAESWRDPGNLLLAVVVFWSYVSFTQFLIIWMGNLPKEIEWYVRRGQGLWKWITILLAIMNLFLPFFVLLSRWVKDRPRPLRKVAALVLSCQILYLYWLLAPSYPGRGASGVHWLDPIVLIAAGAPLAGRFITLRGKEQSHE